MNKLYDIYISFVSNDFKVPNTLTGELYISRDIIRQVIFRDIDITKRENVDLLTYAHHFLADIHITNDDWNSLNDNDRIRVNFDLNNIETHQILECFLKEQIHLNYSNEKNQIDNGYEDFLNNKRIHLLKWGPNFNSNSSKGSNVYPFIKHPFEIDLNNLLLS